MTKQVHILLLFIFSIGVLLAQFACVHQTQPTPPKKQVEPNPVPAGPTHREPSAVSKKSGYTFDESTCGSGNLKFPKARLGMRPGYCAGLVASKEDGLIFPRTIAQVPGSRYFVVVDMGSWEAGKGRVLLLDPEAKSEKLKVLIDKLDSPHGLAIGPKDGKAYVGAVDKVFRFDPLAAQPKETIEVILKNLPGRNLKLPSGSTLEKSSHPLKQFTFDRTGRLFLNMGAPTDNCVSQEKEKSVCWASEGSAPLASIYVYTPPASGIFKALGKSDENPPFKVFAEGLRNSMALAPHPRFPDAGFAFMQGENSRDLPDPFAPNEELNALEEGKHYGWPYCYDNSSVSAEFSDVLKAKSKFKNLCGNSELYRAPHSLMPPHTAPLGMFYYSGNRFPELDGKLIVSWHGYRATGNRIVFYDVDENGFPKRVEAPVPYHVSCDAEPTRPYRSGGEPVQAAAFNELVGEWHKVLGARPQGAPVGIAAADDGAIWVVEDKNQTILRIDVDPTSTEMAKLPCDRRSEAQIQEIFGFVAKSKENRERLSKVRTQMIEKKCMGCHTNFNLKEGLTAGERDGTVLRFLLSQDGWVFPGDPESGRLHRRVWAKGAEKAMPGNAKELIASEPGYKELLETLDAFVANMVPGERKRIKLATSPSLRFRNKNDVVCGSIDNRTVVVVTKASPSEKPGSSRIYRPADKFLNGECEDADGYYIASKYLGSL